MAFVDVQGLRFHVQKIGTGEPVLVLVHGLAPYANMAYWYIAVGEDLPKAASLVLYDLRGFGLSEQPETGYAVEDMVADLAGVLDALDLGDRPVILVGHSYGATVSLHFARAHPERVSAMALIEPYLEEGEVMGLVVKVREIREQETFEAMEARAFDLYEAWLAEDAEMDAEVTRKQVERMRRRKRSLGRDKALALLFQTSLIDDVATLHALTDEELAEITCPALLLYGEESVMRADGDRLARAMPEARLELLSDSGHMMVQTAPKEVAERLFRWLKELPAASG